MKANPQLNDKYKHMRSKEDSHVFDDVNPNEVGDNFLDMLGVLDPKIKEETLTKHEQ